MSFEANGYLWIQKVESDFKLKKLQAWQEFRDSKAQYGLNAKRTLKKGCKETSDHGSR